MASRQHSTILVVSVAVAAALVLALAGRSAAATPSGCRSRVASKAAKAYSSAAAEVSRCSSRIVKGVACNQGARDAALQSLLSGTQSQLLAACDDAVAGSLGFASDDDLVLAVAGASVGDGRDLVDRVYGRLPQALDQDLQRCADKAVKKAAAAGKTLIRGLARCGAGCPASSIAQVDRVFDRARGGIEATCSPTEMSLLSGGDVAAYLGAVRAGAQRVVDALRPGLKPVVSVVTPVPASTLTPPGLPVVVDVVGRVLNVPSGAYVTSFEVNGEPATPTAGGDFAAAVLVSNPTVPAVSLVLRARTTLGVFTATSSVKLNVASLAPDVSIALPVSGAITQASSVVVSGNVIGNLSQADALTVAGVPTSFHPTTGAFSRTVALGTETIQVIEVAVHASSLGTTRHDSVVVLRGLARPIGTPLADAIFTRLNNGGLTAAQPIVQAAVDPAFDPAAIEGSELSGGGTICEFETGAKSMSLRAVAGQTLRTTLDIGAPFHVRICGAPTPFGICNLDYTATHLRVTTDFDLTDQLVAAVTHFQAAFTNGSGFGFSATNALCSLLLVLDVETPIEDGIRETLLDELPAGLNGALGGIDVSGSALGVDLTTSFRAIEEDASGITFRLDANVSAVPAPDAPVITHTLAPVSAPPPLLGATTPGGVPYDLGVCFADAFLNRALAGFMRTGRFHKSIDQLPLAPGVLVPIRTELVGGIFDGDGAYAAACPGCPVTMTLRPTAAAVVRSSAPGEEGDLILTVPNYRLELVADRQGTPVPLIAALVVVEIPLGVTVADGAIVPQTGTVAAPLVRVVENPVGANETAFESRVSELFPLASGELAGLLGEIRLPEFAGLSATPIDSAYVTSCLAIYLDLAAQP